MTRIDTTQLDFKQIQSLVPSNGQPLEDVWYLQAAIVLECAGYEEHIPGLWRHLRSTVSTDEKALLACTRRLREALLKICALAGFPKGINCLSLLHIAIKTDCPALAKELEADTSLRDPVPAAESAQRGDAFFDRVYSQHAQRIKDSMRLSSGGDLDRFALLSVYGELLSELSILNARETGLLQFVACYCSMAVNQAKGHMFGARNLGASKEDIQAAIRLVDAMMPQLPPKPFDINAFPFLSKVDDW